MLRSFDHADCRAEKLVTQQSCNNHAITYSWYAPGIPVLDFKSHASSSLFFTQRLNVIMFNTIYGS